jgi:ABC-type glycerol-3-phosphate transport system substrate-binding protein
MKIRRVLFGLILSCVLILSAFGSGAKEGQTAKPKKTVTLTVIGHRVHEATAGGAEGKGENLIEAFEKQFGVDVIYQTYDSPRVAEKFYQLGPMKNCEEDVIHINQNMQLKQKLKSFLEPLDSYLKRKPIPGFPDKFGALIDAVTVDGKIYAIPIRAGNWAMWYNKAIFKQRGIAAPPKTPEELYEVAKKLTHTSSSGAKIFGWSSRGDLGHACQIFTMAARMWDGDSITPDLKVVINEPPAVKAAEFMRRLYAEGLMPPDWHTFGYAQSVKFFREGTAGLVWEASNYWATFNDKEKSKIAGDAVIAPMPLAAEVASSQRDFAIGSAWFWSQAILKGSQDKEAAWDYIRHLATQNSHLNMALSGNPPPRIDVLSSPQYLDINPGAKIDAMIAPYTRTWIPAFENMMEARDIISEHVHNVVVHGKPAQAEMDEAAKRLKTLLP